MSRLVRDIYHPIFAMVSTNRASSPAGGNARFCGEHREAGMVNVKSKTCELCDKQPNPDSPGMPKVGCLSQSLRILFLTSTVQTS